ncbi:hypothetical protein J4433_00495 [Candidatus Pacearchaeota archaeon]|nr:hypothetical protein [Candidatus Pacearchaeota archaeon]
MKTKTKLGIAAVLAVSAVFGFNSLKELQRTAEWKTPAGYYDKKQLDELVNEIENVRNELGSCPNTEKARERVYAAIINLRKQGIVHERLADVYNSLSNKNKAMEYGNTPDNFAKEIGYIDEVVGDINSLK